MSSAACRPPQPRSNGSAALHAGVDHATLIAEAERTGGATTASSSCPICGSARRPSPTRSGAAPSWASRRPPSRGVLFRAVLEGIALDGGNMLKAMLPPPGQRRAGADPDHRRQHAQSAPDAAQGLGLRPRRSAVLDLPDTTCLGAALLGGLAAGLFRDLEEARRAADGAACGSSPPTRRWTDSHRAETADDLRRGLCGAASRCTRACSTTESARCSTRIRRATIPLRARRNRDGRHALADGSPQREHRGSPRHGSRDGTRPAGRRHRRPGQSLAIALVAMFLGVDPSIILNGLSGRRCRRAAGHGAVRPPTRHRRSERTVRLGGARADGGYLARHLPPGAARRYREPTLVLFNGAGPICLRHGRLGDRAILLPSRPEGLSGHLLLRGARARNLAHPATSPAAYVIAHEVGHHVQTLLGISRQVSRHAPAFRRGHAQPAVGDDGATGRLLRRRLGAAHQRHAEHARAG